MKTFFFSFFLLIIASCVVKKQITGHQTAKYKYNIVRSSGNTNPIITGTVRQKSNGHTMPFAGIKLNNDLLCSADSNGYFNCEFKPGTYHFKAVGVFMNRSETRKIKIQKGDILKIDFFLSDGFEVVH